MYMNNYPVETFGFTQKSKQCAGSRFVQHKTKQLCTFLLKFADRPVVPAILEARGYQEGIHHTEEKEGKNRK